MGLVNQDKSGIRNRQFRILSEHMTTPKGA